MKIITSIKCRDCKEPRIDGTINMTDEHKHAIEANLKEFNTVMANEYDRRESTQVLSILLTKILLEYDVHAKRKTKEESLTVVGEPDKARNGFSKEKTLPSIDSFHSTYGNSVFKPGMKLMDFACGTGIVTQYFAPYISSPNAKTEITGIDINEILLSKFDQKAELVHQKYGPNVTMKSYLYDILDAKIQPEVDSKFEKSMDTIVCTISYHHIDNYQTVTKKLATFLKPGGWLFIIDFYNEDVESAALASDSNTNNASNAVRHMGGLKIDSLNETLGTIAGLTNVSSARETRVHLWQETSFIENHLPQKIVDKLKNNELPSKTSNGTTTYLIETSLVLASGQRKL